MTIQLANSNPVQYQGNGASLIFNYPWKIFAASDLIVAFIIGGVYSIQSSITYTVASIGNNGGGAVTFLTAPPLGTTVDIRPSTTESQPTDFANLGAYLPESTTNGLDRLTRMIQDLCRLAYTFGVHASDNETVAWTALPSPSLRAGQYLGFDANGLPTIYATTPPGTTLSASVIGYFLNPQTQSEQNAGITPTNTLWPAGCPERYIAGTPIYANTAGTVGTDFTAAITAAMSCSLQPVILGAFNYGFSNLIIPPETSIVGQGLNQTSLVALAGSTGTAITDNGVSAAKINLFGFTVFCNGNSGTPSTGNNTTYTHGLYLGKGSSQYGTEGLIDQIVVRDLATGVPGFDITCNIGEFGFLQSLATGGAQFLGTGVFINQMEITGSSGFTVGSEQVSLNVGDGGCHSCEIEGTASGVVNCLWSGNFLFTNLVLSLSAGYTFDHLLEKGASSTTGGVNALKFYFPTSGTNPVITGGNWIDSSSNYFGGNASSASHGGEGNITWGTLVYDYAQRTVGGNLSVNGQFAIGGKSLVTVTNGFGTPTGTTITTDFPGASATLAQTSGQVAILTAILKSYGFLGA